MLNGLSKDRLQNQYFLEKSIVLIFAFNYVLRILLSDDLALPNNNSKEPESFNVLFDPLKSSELVTHTIVSR